MNTTVLVNSTAQLECRTISDLEPHIEWIKFNVDVENPVIPKNMTKLEVLVFADLFTVVVVFVSSWSWFSVGIFLYFFNW